MSPGGLCGRMLTAALAAAVAGLVRAPSARGQEDPGPTAGQRPAAELARAVERVEGLDAMRSSLARAFGATGEEPDRETFERVCRPVGEEASRIARENGWRVQQMAVRFRNPAHRPDAEARSVFQRMREDRDLVGVWRRSVVADRRGWRYFRRIDVESACLTCHGAKEARPSFVKESYPEDRAFGFRVGDLRGLYSVFLPSAEPGTVEASGRAEASGPRSRRVGER